MVLRNTLCLLLMAAGAASAAAQLTNQGVIELLEGQVPERTVITMIESSEVEFDTSPSAIVELSKAGIPDAVMEAMIRKNTRAAEQSADAAEFNPEEILLIDGDRELSMRYVHSSTYTKARALGWGGIATYAVLPGKRAQLRLAQTRPSFVVAVPGNAQPNNYLTLASFAARRNDTREVLIGGGYVSYSTGIHRDRVIETAAEEMQDQSNAPKGFALFKLTPKQPLEPGEYALVTYNSSVRTLGWFAAGGDSYFDFGIDG